MKSFEIEVQLDADEFIDWLDEEVIDVPILYEDRIIEQTYVALERAEHEDDDLARSIALLGRLDVYREGMRMPLGLPDVGQVVVDVVPLGNNASRVVVAYDPNPCMLERMKQLRSQMRDELTQPQADTVEEGVGVTEEPAPFRRGGPLGPSDDEKLRLVSGWLRVQGRQTQEVYAQLQGRSASTLRRYIRDLKAKGMI